MTRFVAGSDGKRLRVRPVPVIRTDLVRAELRRAERDGVTVAQDPGVAGDGSYLEGYFAALRVAIRLGHGSAAEAIEARP